MRCGVLLIVLLCLARVSARELQALSQCTDNGNPALQGYYSLQCVANRKQVCTCPPRAPTCSVGSAGNRYCLADPLPLCNKRDNANPGYTYQCVSNGVRFCNCPGGGTCTLGGAKNKFCTNFAQPECDGTLNVCTSGNCFCPPQRGYCEAGQCVPKCDGTVNVCTTSNCFCAPPNDFCNPLSNQCEECFPADAIAHVEGRGATRMEHLKIGDRVLTSGADGSLQYEDVMYFGHQDPKSWATMVVLEVVARATNATRTLRLTTQHFVPTLHPAGGLLHKYAEDVTVGDRLLVTLEGPEGPAVVGEVARIDREVDRGRYAPFTKSGFIVVDGVLTSSHASFVLDGVTPKHLRHHLPAVYQVLYRPLVYLYELLGPQRMAAFNDALIPRILEHIALFKAFLVALGAQLALGAFLAGKSLLRA